MFLWIGLRTNLNRKPPIFPLNMRLSCKFSLKPIDCWLACSVDCKPRFKLRCLEQAVQGFSCHRGMKYEIVGMMMMMMVMVSLFMSLFLSSFFLLLLCRCCCVVASIFIFAQDAWCFAVFNSLLMSFDYWGFQHFGRLSSFNVNVQSLYDREVTYLLTSGCDRWPRRLPWNSFVPSSSLRLWLAQRWELMPVYSPSTVEIQLGELDNGVCRIPPYTPKLTILIGIMMIKQWILG